MSKQQAAADWEQITQHEFSNESISCRYVYTFCLETGNEIIYHCVGVEKLRGEG
jgi:hypothetical protein